MRDLEDELPEYNPEGALRAGRMASIESSTPLPGRGGRNRYIIKYTFDGAGSEPETATIRGDSKPRRPQLRRAIAEGTPFYPSEVNILSVRSP